MICKFHKKFYDDLDKVDKKMYRKIEEVLIQIEKCKKLTEIKNIKKLSGTKNYYRIRVGNYRMRPLQN